MFVDVFTLFVIVWSFLELVPYILKIPGVKYFLSEHLSQDPLEKILGASARGGGLMKILLVVPF